MTVLGRLSFGQVASDPELDDGLRRLNNMLESWNMDPALTYEVTRDVFTLTADQNPHTIGLAVDGANAGDFDVVRPLKIKDASIIMAGESNEVQLAILSEKQWQDIPAKETDSKLPRSLWYEREFPVGKIHLYPIPNEAATKLVLYVREQLPSGLTLLDKLSLPPGYARGLEYALALDIAPGLGVVPSPDLLRIVMEAKAAVVRMDDEGRPMMPISVPAVEANPSLQAGGGNLAGQRRR